MKVLKIFSLMAIIAMLAVTGCSKHMNPVAPEENDEPDIKIQSLLAVYSVETDETPLSGVAVYRLEGMPATLRAWPEAGRNMTPVEFSQVEPGSYTIVGIKAGYDTTYTSVVIAEGVSETVYLVMHKTPPPPIPATPYIQENLVWNETTQSDWYILKTNVAGTCTKQITYIVLDGSSGPMLAIQLFTGRVYKFNPDNSTYYAGFDCKVVQKNDEFQVDLGQEHVKDYLYSRVTFIYGPDIIVSQWHYDGRFGYPEPVLLSNRLFDEDAGQWDKMTRRTQ